MNAARLQGVRVLATLRSPELFGSERGNIEAFKVLRAQGAEVCVAVPTYMDGGAVRAELERLAFPTVSMPFGFQWSKSFFRREPHLVAVNLWHWARCHLKFDRLVRRFRPTHVHLGNPLTFNFIEGVVRWHRLRLVIRMGDAAPVSSAVQMWMWRRYARRSTRAMAISEFIWRDAALHCSSLRAQPKRVIYNLAPTPARPPDIPDYELGGQHIVYVGQMTQEKGIFHIVEAADQLRKRFPNAHYHLVGGSNHTLRTEAALRKLVAARSLDGRIHLHGWKANAQLFYAHAAVHVAPSIWAEPLGNVVVEAKREGTPSVVYPSGGLPEMIRHRVDGFVCVESTAAALAEGIAWLLERQAARADWRAEVRADFHARFGPERFAKAWAEMYELV